MPIPGGSGSIPGSPGAGGESAAVGVALLSMLKRSYRIAGISKTVGSTLQDDWFSEGVEELNAMVGGMNCDRLNIFTIRIDTLPLIVDQKVYTVGSGADFDMPRPQKIINGVIYLGDPDVSGTVSMPPMYQMNDEEWALIPLQDVSNGIPLSFYYDRSYATDTGYARIYLWPQTTESYYVKWYTWQAVPTFSSKDDIFSLPDGYEDHFVYALARRLAALNPHQSRMTTEALKLALEAKAAFRKLNAPIPKLFVNDAANVGSSRSGYFDYRIGINRPGGSW